VGGRSRGKAADESERTPLKRRGKWCPRNDNQGEKGQGEVQKLENRISTGQSYKNVVTVSKEATKGITSQIGTERHRKRRAEIETKIASPWGRYFKTRGGEKGKELSVEPGGKRQPLLRCPSERNLAFQCKREEAGQAELQVLEEGEGEQLTEGRVK